MVMPATAVAVPGDLDLLGGKVASARPNKAANQISPFESCTFRASVVTRCAITATALDATKQSSQLSAPQQDRTFSRD